MTCHVTDENKCWKTGNRATLSPSNVGAGHPNDVFFLYVVTPPKPQSLNHIMSEYYTNLKYSIKELR